MKGEYARLTRESPKDFLSMRMSVSSDGARVQLDNDARIKRMLEYYGMADCNPKKQPFTRCQLIVLG